MTITYFRVKNGKVSDLETLKKNIGTIAIPAALLATPCNVNAADVKSAMKPLITALQDLAEPTAYAFMIYGGLKYISGKSSEGAKVLKQAIGGYVLIQWIPWIFDIIKGVGGR